MLRAKLSAILRKNGKFSLLNNIRKQNPNPFILDIGCGNESVIKTKSIIPNCFYVGIDIYQKNHEQFSKADKMYFTKPEKFADKLTEIPYKFDVVISSHNLEHCNNRSKTFRTMLSKIKKYGFLYLSFPCEQSVHFPSRRGTLNYCDDKTHVYPPPSFQKLIIELKEKKFQILYSSQRYRPWILFICGLFIEVVSFLLNKTMRGTWELYGFESIIVAQKRK